MDITFSCPGCGVSLEVESEASGQQFACPSCNRTVTVPAAPAVSATLPKPPTGLTPPSKSDKRFAVPVTQNPVESLIQKPNKSLEAASKEPVSRRRALPAPAHDPSCVHAAPHPCTVRRYARKPAPAIPG